MNQIVHEANNGDSLDKVFDIARGVANVGTGLHRQTGNYSYSSIAKAASQMIAIFPVIASRTVSPESAQMISKYIEQKACTMITLGLQQANISTAKSGIEYLKQFHQNLDIGGSGNSKVILGLMQSWVDAYERGYKNESNIENMMNTDIDYSFLFEADTDLEISSMEVKKLLELMKHNESIQVYDTKLNPVSINDYIVNEFADGNYHVSIKKYNPLNEAVSQHTDEYNKLPAKYRAIIDSIIAREEREAAVNGRMYMSTTEERKWAEYYASLIDKYDYEYKMKKREWEEDDRTQSRIDKINQEKDKEEEKKYRDKKRRWEEEDRDESKRDKKTEEEYKNKKRRWEEEDRARATDERKKAEQDKRDERLASISGAKVKNYDQNIKKMNDAVPSMLVVRFYQSDTASVATEFIIGVKSKLIPVTTPEILRRIMNDNKDGKKFLNFMRVMTGELKASDVLFGIARIKDDLKSTKVKGAYGDMWNLLANRAKAANERVKHGQNNDFSAITTVVISQQDVDELYREENFDIAKPKNALHFMQSYNLMSFIIVDEATEIVKVLMDDSSKTFEEFGFRQFDREAQDGTYKKLINLMSASK